MRIGSRRCRGPQPAAHGEAVDDRHHHVEHDDVGLAAVDGLERLLAVADRLDVVALEAQREHERLAHAAVVLGDEDVVLGAVVRPSPDPTASGKTTVRTRALTRFLRHCAASLTGSDNHRVVRLTTPRRHAKGNERMRKQLGLAAIGLAGSPPAPERAWSSPAGAAELRPDVPPPHPTRRRRPAARTDPAVPPRRAGVKAGTPAAGDPGAARGEGHDHPGAGRRGDRGHRGGPAGRRPHGGFGRGPRPGPARASGSTRRPPPSG